MTRPRVLLADDHGPMLACVIGLVSAEFDVVGAVSDGQAAVDAAAVLQPDLVFFDISRPVRSGLAAAAHLAESAHPPRIVFLTVHEDPAFVDAARTVGAMGYVIKRRIGTDLMPAIHLALEGLTQFTSTAVEPHHHSTLG